MAYYANKIAYYSIPLFQTFQPIIPENRLIIPAKTVIILQEQQCGMYTNKSKHY